MSVAIRQAPPEHVGLGTGTQLSMAIAVAVDRLLGRSSPREELARRTGRGARSAIGVHGFFSGGFLVDGGKRPAADAPAALAPLVARVEVPRDWRFVLLTPDLPPGLAGELERRAFREGISISPSTTERLSRLLLLGMLPALQEGDHAVFSAALHEYNRRVGECFAPVQGGCYAHPVLGGMIERIRGWGIAGVGQSSWGPTLFAAVEDQDAAERLARNARLEFSLSDGAVVVTSAARAGSLVEESHDGTADVAPAARERP